jgi:hypothetical protein
MPCRAFESGHEVTAVPVSYLTLLYWAALASYLAASLLSFMRYPAACRLAGWAAIVINGAGLAAMAAAADRPPLYGPFEVFQAIAFIFALLYVCFDRAPASPLRTPWPVCSLLFLLVLLDTLRLNPDYCQYDNLWVILFFVLRLTAMGILLFAAFSFFSSLAGGRKPAERDIFLHRGRNFLILGAAVFLAGEYSGSYWCLNGWGDAWLWNHRFFLSALMFFLSMLACHLPADWLQSGRRRAWMGAVPLTLLIVLFIHSQFH